MTKSSRSKHKPKAEKSPEAEYERFLETAREVEASDDPSDLDKAVIRISPSKPKKPDQ